MDIQQIKDFYIISTIDKHDEAPKILIGHSQIKNQVEVVGKILEAQYRFGNFFLLLISEGNPLEEALYIYYLNCDLQVQDALEISVMYAEGLLRNLSVFDSNKIVFSFFENDEQWMLEILSSPQFVFLKNKYPIKRRMSLFKKSWLNLNKMHK